MCFISLSFTSQVKQHRNDQKFSLKDMPTLLYQSNMHQISTIPELYANVDTKILTHPFRN